MSDQRDIDKAENALVWALDKASTSLEVRNAVHLALGLVRTSAAEITALRAQSDVRAPAPIRSGPEVGEPMRETCIDCGKIDPCDDDCPNWIDPSATGEAISPAAIAEDCAKIAEGHVGAANDPNYDEACRDIAKAIRDTHIVEGAGK